MTKTTDTIPRLLLLGVSVCLVWATADCARGTAREEGDAGGVTLLVNGGFEADGREVPTGWNLDSAVAGKGALSLEKSKGRDGGSALRLAPNSRNLPGPKPFALGQVIESDSVRGKKVRVSAWLGAEGGATAVVGMYLLKKDGGMLGGFQLRQPTNAGALVLQKDVIEVPSGRDVGSFIVFLAAEGTSGAAYFDDINMAVDQPGGAVETAGKRDSPHEAKVIVYAGRKIREIPRTLFGTNVEWINDGNSIWDSKRGRIDPEVVRLARELKVSRIRFGSDSYHWRDGVGPQDARPTTPHWGTGGDARSRHSFGTDEALSFAEQIGASLHILANVGTGTPQEAADWVRYVNAQDGPEQQHVEFWEIGNELYMKDDLSGGSMAPKAYAERFLAFAQAMKKVDPSIKLAAIGGENYGRYAFVQYPDWNQTVLKLAGDQIDYLAVHNAYAPLVIDGGAVEPRRVYQAMLAAPVLIRRNLETLASQIDSFSGKNASRIKIAVTEWGPFFHVDLKSPFVDHVKTLGSGLLTAGIMKVLIESPCVEVANFFKLTEASFMGWIGRRGDVCLPTAPYYALMMYTRHFGDVLVESHTESPTYDAPGVGLVAAVDDVPYLDVVAGISADGETLYALAINKHFDQPITARISIEGFRPRSSAQAWTLRGSGPDANTGTDLPKLPTGWAWGKQTEVEPYRRFHSGGPGEVTLSSASFDGAAEVFTYTFPAFSVTSIELRKAK
ncbi:MAG: hypothetical protein JSU63_18625 [Phycisphaerales bacterium]|nr:MAG: hypothetical protein JSU63_18625 [Phycisphaerales bacterium]